MFRTKLKLLVVVGQEKNPYHQIMTEYQSYILCTGGPRLVQFLLVQSPVWCGFKSALNSVESPVWCGFSEFSFVKQLKIGKKSLILVKKNPKIWPKLI